MGANWYGGLDLPGSPYAVRRPNGPAAVASTSAAAPPADASLRGPGRDLGNSPLSISELDMTDQLAAYVLGTSNAFARQRAASKPQPAVPDDGRSAVGASAGAGANGAAEDDGIDFSAQPQLFRVRGVLSLPPLKVRAFKSCMMLRAFDGPSRHTASTVTCHIICHYCIYFTCWYDHLLIIARLLRA